MSSTSSGIAISGSSLTSWRISSIGKSGARSSGPTGCPVPGCRIGSIGFGMSARTLYQCRGSADSSSRNFVCAIGAEHSASAAPDAPRFAVAGRRRVGTMRLCARSSAPESWRRRSPRSRCSPSPRAHSPRRSRPSRRATSSTAGCSSARTAARATAWPLRRPRQRRPEPQRRAGRYAEGVWVISGGLEHDARLQGHAQAGSDPRRRRVPRQGDERLTGAALSRGRRARRPSPASARPA